MLERPGDIVKCSILALAILGTSVWGLRVYLKTYHRPAQNWLPQGSFWPDQAGLPQGWQSTGARLLKERTRGHTPLWFVHLSQQARLATVLPLEPGWRGLHVSAWLRGRDPTVEARLQGTFYAQGRPLTSYALNWEVAADWKLREAQWPCPAGADELRLECQGPGPSGIDLAEVAVVPSFVGRWPNH